ncbi:hypothetical protein NPIL_621991 [Nephila pilipes]|uniref:Uncharacterized protein n=1 Tax=Nephila pilipes TaxID=299642 RepID=A0A8X6R1F6_NEPPI|nr:hypothetical protein NPIL_621991 [Nephila pilipes]
MQRVSLFAVKIKKNTFRFGNPRNGILIFFSQSGPDGLVRDLGSSKDAAELLGLSGDLKNFVIPLFQIYHSIHSHSARLVETVLLLVFLLLCFPLYRCLKHSEGCAGC